jgi:hypothetical protein
MPLPPVFQALKLLMTVCSAAAGSLAMVASLASEKSSRLNQVSRPSPLAAATLPSNCLRGTWPSGTITGVAFRPFATALAFAAI